MKSTAFLFLIPLIFSMTACQPSDDELLQEAKALPKEHIQQYQYVSEYLKKNRVYISLTTSPSRITHLDKVLSILDLEFIHKIILNLPEKYGRDGSSYTIPESLRNFDKLLINRIPQDLGPITKLLPTALLLKDEPDSIIITIDDDSALPFGTVGQLIKYVTLTDSVVGARGNNLDFYRLARKTPWEPTETVSDCGKDELSRCDLTEGISGIGYKVKFINVADMLMKNSLSKECRFSDDLTIMHSLAEAGIARYQIRNKYTPPSKHLSSSGDSNASWRGGGILDKPSNGDFNPVKYGKCHNLL